MNGKQKKETTNYVVRMLVSRIGGGGGVRESGF